MNYPSMSPMSDIQFALMIDEIYYSDAIYIGKITQEVQKFRQSILGEIRQEILWFAKQMEEKLKANDHKPGWKDDSFDVLLERLKEECLELRSTVYFGLEKGLCNESEVVKEAVDVANFAMMIADNAANRLRNDAKGDNND